MTSATDTTSSTALDPISRISEILFGLIMVLTFTGSLSVATAGQEDVREMLIGALGCNLVWGIIDALLYLMSTYTSRARSIYLLKTLRLTSDPVEGHGIIRDALPELIGQLLEETHVEHLRKQLVVLGPMSGKLTLSDLRAAFLVFALVFLSVFPVAVPFLVMHEPSAAMRVSNGIAIALLFGAGSSLAHYTGASRLIWGTVTAIVGIIVVGMTIALGG